MNYKFKHLDKDCRKQLNQWAYRASKNYITTQEFMERLDVIIDVCVGQPSKEKEEISEGVALALDIGADLLRTSIGTEIMVNNKVSQLDILSAAIMIREIATSALEGKPKEECNCNSIMWDNGRYVCSQCNKVMTLISKEDLSS